METLANQSQQTPTIQSEDLAQKHSRLPYLLGFLLICVILISVSGSVGFLIGKNKVSQPPLKINETDSQVKLNTSPSISVDTVVSTWISYTVPETILKFKLPTDINPVFEPNLIKIPINGETLLINFTTNGKEPQGYSGTPAGDWKISDTVEFLGNNIQKTNLVYDPVGVTFVVYSLGRPLTKGNYQFKITLNWDSGINTGISKETQMLADKILSTVQLEEGITSNTILDQIKLDLKQYSWSKAVLKNKDYYYPNKTQLSSISGQEITATIPDNFDIKDFYNLEKILEKNYGWVIDNNNSAGGATSTLDSFLRNINNKQQALLLLINQKDKYISLFVSDQF